MSTKLVVSFVHAGLARSETIEVATQSVAKRVKKRLLEVLPTPAHVVILPPPKGDASHKSQG